MRHSTLKLKHSPDPIDARKKQYAKRDAASLHAIWEALENLAEQGIEIGEVAQTELQERQKIKDTFPKGKP